MKFLLPLLASAALIGCNSTQESSQANQRNASEFRETIVVSGEPNFYAELGSTICRHPTLVTALSNPQRSDVQAYNAILEELVAQLTQRGYQLSAQADDRCDYWIAFAVPTGNQLSEDQLMDMFGVSPGLAGGGEDLERATMLLRLYQPGTNIVLWQLSYQAFARLVQDEQGRRQLALEPEALKYVVEKALAYLPQQIKA